MDVSRNSDLFAHFMEQKDRFNLQLAWKSTTQQEHKLWRDKFSAQLRKLIGHCPQQVALQVHWEEKLETDAFTRYKIYVQSEADYWVPAYYFVPHNIRDQVPAIVCLHGHSGIYPYIREGDKHQKQKCQELSLDYAPFFAEQGYITIAPIQRGWNETAVNLDKNESGCERMVLNTFLTGQTPVGLRAWDASRLIDFLQTQSTVDADKIGVAGLSGAVPLRFSGLRWNHG